MTATTPVTLDVPESSILRVSSTSNSSKLASAIAHAVYEAQHVALRAIGAGAVNQAVKAIAIAQGFAGQRGIVLYMRPGFDTVTMPDGAKVSAIVIEAR